MGMADLAVEDRQAINGEGDLCDASEVQLDHGEEQEPCNEVGICEGLVVDVSPDEQRGGNDSHNRHLHATPAALNAPVSAALVALAADADAQSSLMAYGECERVSAIRL